MLLSKFKVVGNSMEPTLKYNQIVIASSIPFFIRRPRIGDMIILNRGRCIIKRIAKVKKNKVFVVGDNRKESTDSRSFGWINIKEISGKVMLKI